MRRQIFSVSVSDTVTKETIKEATKNTALSWNHTVPWVEGLEAYLEKAGLTLCVSLETAHPAKFPDEIIELLALPRVAARMRGIDKRKGERRISPATTAGSGPPAGYP